MEDDFKEIEDFYIEHFKKPVELYVKIPGNLYCPNIKKKKLWILKLELKMHKLKKLKFISYNLLTKETFGICGYCGEKHKIPIEIKDISGEGFR